MIIDVDHPEETTIERYSADDPEWLDTDGTGLCYGCSAANPLQLAAMEKAGKLDGDDPWGALNAPMAAATGGSGSSTRPSNLAIATGVLEQSGKTQRHDDEEDLPGRPTPHPEEDEEDVHRTIPPRSRSPAALSRPAS